VIRHEQHAELALYASATFGSPAFKTLYKALHNGWLTNYPSLTAKMFSRNQPHSPATALGHITASRSGIRSTKPKTQTSLNPSFGNVPLAKEILANLTNQKFANPKK
jgi:hypothetical protein